METKTKMHGIAHVFVGVVGFAAVAAGLMHLANWLLPPLGVAEIGFGHALGILVLLVLLRRILSPGRGEERCRRSRRASAQA